MQERKYERKDGTEGSEYTLEAGDVIEPEYDQVFKVENVKYPKNLLKSKWNDKEVMIRITEGQRKQLEKIGKLHGKKLEAYTYDNEKRKGNIGLREKKD